MVASKSTSKKTGSHVTRRSRKRNSRSAKIGPNNGSLGDVGKTGRGTIRIRMYRVGFGDCFLVSLPVQDGNQNDKMYHILVDCGVHSRGNIGNIGQVVDNIAEVTGGKLAIAIASHAHQDHISGFGDKFSSFEIGEVWLPWTWDPNNPRAVKLQKRQAAIVAYLTHYSKALTGNSIALDALSNLTNNEHAISLLKSAFGVNAKVRYLKAGDKLISRDLTPDSSAVPVPGLSVSILGPPESEDFLAKMDPPVGEHYLRMISDVEKGRGNTLLFNEKWVIRRVDPQFASVKLEAEYAKKLQDTVKSPVSELAFVLDKARNNESVVVLFVFRGKYMLFPGDAEYGNWEWWLENMHSSEILPQVTFFKVAHHGSVNATPKDALERMSEGGFAAMVSTQSKPWPSIPHVPLMVRLNAKSQQRVVRSDWLRLDNAPGPLPGSQPPLPPVLPAGFVEGAFWIDYFVSL
jgi:beta-lactamase superfamily II metal-dependent hydrolase